MLGAVSGDFPAGRKHGAGRASACESFPLTGAIVLAKISPGIGKTKGEPSMAWTEIADYDSTTPFSDSRSTAYCKILEQGGILFFKQIPFDFPLADREWLLNQKQSGFKAHKNISYRPGEDVLRGDATDTPEQRDKLLAIMRNFSQQVVSFAERFLQPYAGKWRLDFASYRSVEESGRDLPLHKRNDLMHVDAFPTRPTHGGRILRIFTNINPARPRVWEVTDGFTPIAKAYAEQVGLKKFAAGVPLRGAIAPLLKAVGVKGADRSAYDRFMLRFHDYLKENEKYQKEWPKTHIEFPPNSTWLVYTDTVPHAVMSGQYALEQTFIIPRSALVAPEAAPIAILESLAGRQLAKPA
jgi:hypothetical protein